MRRIQTPSPPQGASTGGWDLRKQLATALAVALMATLTAGVANADHEDGLYELPSIAQWGTTHLRVLIVPPAHGQVLNAESGILNGNDPDELTPFNSYLDAIEEAIDAWPRAIDRFGTPELRAAFRQDVYVLGRDTVPPDVLVQPDILVVTDEDEGPALGTAIRVVPCVVRMSKSFILSFTYADMYNVTAQEYGHCLGLRHVGSQGGVEPTSGQKHPEHDVMNGFYTHTVGSAGTHRHCISNLDVLALEYVFSTQNTSPLPTGGGSSTTFMPVGAYGDTCVPPPSDWRDKVPSSTEPQPDPEMAPSSEITGPSSGASLKRKSFKLVTGTASEGDDEVTLVEVAVVRKVGSGCRWWDASGGFFVSQACSEPLWNAASGTDSWRLKLGATLPKGRYDALSIATSFGLEEECCEPGRNRISFRLQ